MGWAWGAGRASGNSVLLSDIPTSPQAPDTLWRTSEIVCKGEVGGRQRSQAWSKCPSPVDPSTLLLGVPYPECTPPPTLLSSPLHPVSSCYRLRKGAALSTSSAKRCQTLESTCPSQEGLWCSCECPRASAQDVCRIQFHGNCAGKAGLAQSRAWGCRPRRAPLSSASGPQAVSAARAGPELPPALLLGLCFPPLTFHPGQVLTPHCFC